MQTHDDPLLAQALHRISNVRDLLTRIERVLSLPRRYITADLTFPLRAIQAIEHQAAQAWNCLSVVREPVPEPRPNPSAPHPDFRAIEARGCDIPRTNEVTE